jgi:putative transposase
MLGSNGKYRKRCERWDMPWRAHHLTFSCFHEKPFFNGKQSPVWFIEALDNARRKAPFDLWAWVIMPEHIHLVLLPAEQTTISEILYHLKKPMTTRVLAWLRKNDPSFLSHMLDVQPNGESYHRFWERGGGYDRNLRSVEDIHEKIKYVHLNPVRRKLVERPEDWAWSSYRTAMEGLNTPIRLDRESLPPLES